MTHMLYTQKHILFLKDCNEIILSLQVFNPNKSSQAFLRSAVLMSRGDAAERAAESLLAIVAIWLYDEEWICLTSLGQHKGLNSKWGTRGPSWQPA